MFVLPEHQVLVRPRLIFSHCWEGKSFQHECRIFLILAILRKTGMTISVTADMLKKGNYTAIIKSIECCHVIDQLSD